VLFEELGRRLGAGEFLDFGGQAFHRALAFGGIALGQFLEAGGEDLARFDDGFDIALGEFAGIAERGLALFKAALAFSEASLNADWNFSENRWRWS
jgi:hypothetical protein